jgi:mRNA-degrading endonuclease RelE of RelBE toxin-antitoxin system
MSSDDWSWKFRKPARETYDSFDEHTQNRITDKLNDIVDDQWRDPDEYLEPLTGAPYSKLRIGQFRLGAECNYEEKLLDVYTIERRRGAYKGDDD